MIKALDIQYLRHFLEYAKPYRRYSLAGVALLPMTVVTSLLIPWLTIRVIDNYLAIGRLDGLIQISLLLVGVILLNYLSDACYSYLLRYTGQRTIFDMRMVLFSRILKFPRSYFENVPTGTTLTRLTSDLESISESFVMSVLSLVKDMITTVALIVMMLVIDWRLTLIVVVVMPPMLLITRWVRNKLRQGYLVSRRALAKGTGYLQECLQGVKTVQLFGAEEEVERTYKGHNDEFLRAQLKTNKYDAALVSIITGITTLTIGLMIWHGSSQILAGVLTPGVLIAFISTMEKVFVPIRDFTSQIASIQRSFAAFDHVDELFAQPLQEQGRALLSAAEISGRLDRFESLEFRNVYFRYSPDSPYVLKGVSFKLERGHQLALVGTTGSGKSTILRLVSKVYLDYEGSILLNGIELSQLSIDDSQHLFSLMQQDVYLFEQSIRFNIALGKEGIDETQVRQAARYVYADQFIETQPQQYDMPLSRNGANLSAGQTQLISFARSVAQGGDVIRLDVATSSVYSVPESLIKKAIIRLFEEKTVIAALLDDAHDNDSDEGVLV
ncbi:MAG: ABC transporter ATP-binding protein [Reinekea sp.]